jgi:hypothetical protein
MNRFPSPRRALPQHGEGCSLVEPLDGPAADFVRSGGTHCPLCGAEVELGDMEADGRTITIAASCECGFRAKAVYRLIDAEL